MIEEFLASWPLFQSTYLAGWLVAVTLALPGVLVVSRDQIFLGAALAQAATLGIAVALGVGTFGGGHGSLGNPDLGTGVAAVGCSIAAAWLAGRGAMLRESPEAITGAVYLLSASVAILVVAKSPHGLEEIHRLLSSSIVGAGQTDVWIFGALALIGPAVLAFALRSILLLTLDPVMAEAVGIRVRAWNLALSAWLGLVVGLSIRTSGALYAFGCLVLPALVAKSFTRELQALFWAAPAVALCASVVAFVIAHARDLPPAQMTVGVLSGMLVLVWTVRRH